MLERLFIRDFILVDRLELDFSSGFGALTGETGAGKSILVDALGLLMGGRAEASVVRNGCERAELSAEFACAGHDALADWLREQDFEPEEGVVIARRVIDAGGRSRAYINGAPASVAVPCSFWYCCCSDSTGPGLPSMLTCHWPCSWAGTFHR